MSLGSRRRPLPLLLHAIGLWWAINGFSCLTKKIFMEASPFWGWPSIILPPHFTEYFFTWRTMASSHEGKIITTIPCQRIQSLVSWVCISAAKSMAALPSVPLFLWGHCQSSGTAHTLAPGLQLDPINSARVSNQYSRDRCVYYFAFIIQKQRFHFSFLTRLLN